MAPRLFRWWLVAEEALRVSPAPRADIDRSDREVERVFHDSLLFTAARRARAVIARAWADSWLLVIWKPIEAELLPAESVARVRVVGLITSVAALTALILQALSPAPPGPLSWILPSLSAVAGASIACAAAPIARALRNKG